MSMRIWMLAALFLMGCSKEKIFDGMVDKPSSAEQYEVMSTAHAGPVEYSLSTRAHELWVVPNGEAQELINNLDEALVKRGFRIVGDQQYPDQRILTYWTSDNLTMSSVAITAPSFNQTGINWHELYPKGSTQNP